MDGVLGAEAADGALGAEAADGALGADPLAKATELQLLLTAITELESKSDLMKLRLIIL